MSVNLSNRASRSAIIHYRGQYFFTKDAIAIAPDLKPFGVQADAFPDVDARFGGRILKCTFTPMGAWTDPALKVLFPFASFTKGQFNTPMRKVTAVDTGANTLTVTNHRQITGTGVVLASSGTVPAGLTADTTYYVIVVDANTIKLAATEANATADVPTAIDLTGAGTGTIRLIQNSPMLINYLDGDMDQLVVHNAAITKMPSLSLGATKTAFGQVEITGYPRHGTNWDDDDSIFTLGTHTDDASAIDPTNIPTVKYTAQFGDAAPFDSLQPRDGVTVDFNLGLDEISEDGEGILCHRLSDLSAMVKLLPLSLTEGDLWGQLGFQGAGAGMGKSLPAETLTLAGPGNSPFIQIFGAQMQDGPLKISAKDDRIAEISFKTKQTFTGASVNPIFSVATSD